VVRREFSTRMQYWYPLTGTLREHRPEIETVKKNTLEVFSQLEFLGPRNCPQTTPNHPWNAGAMKAPIDNCQCFPRLEVRNVLEAELKAQLRSPETSIETYKCWFSKGERKKISRNIKSTRSLASLSLSFRAQKLCSSPVQPTRNFSSLSSRFSCLYIRG
jgi:hypothetical protein